MLSRDSIDLIFDSGTADGFTPESYSTQILDDLGLLLGLPITTAPSDCMCRFCPITGLCTYGTAVPTSQTDFGLGFPVDCGLAPTANETTLLETTLGCR